MPGEAPRFLSASASDRGAVRGNNEDRVYADDARGLYAVVDGMGGHEAGEQAAEIAVERIKARLERQTGTVEQRMREAIALANNAIFEAAETHPEWSGMACVLTAAVIEDGHVTVGHVGDSRLYRIRRGAIQKITHDHSPVGEREDAGELTEAEAMQHPRRNEVFRDVGSQPRTPDDEDFIEIVRIPFESDAALLLCSDGLSDAIPSSKILETVERNAGRRESATRELVQAATQTGRDNISVVLVEGQAFSKSRGRKRSIGLPLAIALLCGLLLGSLLGGAGSWFWLRANTPAQSASPRTVTVAPPQTIAAALGGLNAGDRIVLSSGTYRGDVVLSEGIAIGAQRAHEAVIEGSVTADGLQTARLEGVNVHGSVRAVNSNLSLNRDEIDGGIELSGNSRAEIAACAIRNPNGPALSIDSSARARLENNVIESSVQPAAAPALVVRSSELPVTNGNVFTGSDAAEPIWLPKADNAILDRNYFPGFSPKDRHPKVRIVAPIGAPEAQP